MIGKIERDTTGFEEIYRLGIYDGEALIAELYASVDQYREKFDDILGRLRMKRVGEWGDEIEIEF